MPSLKDLRNRITSVKATQKITKAMQMVAAAKLRRAQEAAEASRPFFNKMEQMLSNLAWSVRNEPDQPQLLSGTGQDHVHLLVVCTAERGLCGGFNNAIARLARDHADRLLQEGKTVEFLCIGKKGADALRRTHGKRIVEVVELRSVRKILFSHADGIATKVLERFASGKFDVCTLFYGEFKSIISQVPRAQQIIPVLPQEKEPTGQLESVYVYEPNEEELLLELLPRNVSVKIFGALLENAASEQGARMSAMDNATRNAGDMITRLSLSYNRQRQAQITKELIEIISGAEAV